MANEVMAFNEADIKGMTLTTSEFDTLKFLAEHAGIKMDEEAQEEFVSQRNIRINDIVNIWELKAKAKKLCDYIDTVMKLGTIYINYEETNTITPALTSTIDGGF